MKASNQLIHSNKVPLSAFTNYIFKHPNASATYSELMTALGAEASPRVIILTGPTGGGKSTLVRLACNRLLQDYEKQMVEESDFVPVVTISAVPPNGAGFNVKEFRFWACRKLAIESH